MPTTTNSTCQFNKWAYFRPACENPNDAPLDKLGAQTWLKKKKKPNKRLKTWPPSSSKFTQRAATQGIAITPPQLSSFTQSCPFVLTTDQQQAVEDIISDLESSTNGSTLMCGCGLWQNRGCHECLLPPSKATKR